jgi:hypothetical protein
LAPTPSSTSSADEVRRSFFLAPCFAVPVPFLVDPVMFDSIDLTSSSSPGSLSMFLSCVIR